ncbi:MAG: hypothetical protein ABSB49_15880 [Polyangia bacterium]
MVDEAEERRDDEDKGEQGDRRDEANLLPAGRPICASGESALRHHFDAALGLLTAAHATVATPEPQLLLAG